MAGGGLGDVYRQVRDVSAAAGMVRPLTGAGHGVTVTPRRFTLYMAVSATLSQPWPPSARQVGGAAQQLEGGHSDRNGHARAGAGTALVRGVRGGSVGRRPNLIPHGQDELAGHGFGRPPVPYAQDDGKLVATQAGHHVLVAQVPP